MSIYALKKGVDSFMKLNSHKEMQITKNLEKPFSLTSDDQKFLKFCFVFLLIGSILNLYSGIHTSNGGYIINGILLGAVSVGVWQVRKITTLKMNA